MEELNGELEFQRVNLLQNRLQPPFQVFPCPGLAFGASELGIIRQRTAVEISGFVEQFNLLIILGGHCSILRLISPAQWI